jgi:hypothetical protein
LACRTGGIIATKDVVAEAELTQGEVLVVALAGIGVPVAIVVEVVAVIRQGKMITFPKIFSIR